MDPNIPPKPIQNETPIIQPNPQPINIIPTPKNKWKRALIVIMFLIIVGTGGYMLRKIKFTKPTSTQDSAYSPTSIPTIPATSASAITSPPSSMEGINTHTELYSGTGADQNLITFGPKVDNYSRYTPYIGKRGFEFDLNSKSPLLAPMDMTLVGFQNNSTEYKIENRQKITPVNDLMLSFESDSPDWPGVVIMMYHLYSSPLILGHYQNSECGDIDVGSNKFQSEGHQFFSYDDYTVSPKNNAEACGALIGRKVRRGDVIGYAGNVGDHSFASFCFKVPDKSINPTVKSGNLNLHWVQPASFFYWKSYSPDAIFPNGVLAYPFEIDGYQLPAEQRDVNFKYSSKK